MRAELFMANAQDEQEPAIQPNSNATLAKINTLGGLWIEYTVGIGQRKPAKDFTPSERDCVKDRYIYCHKLSMLISDFRKLRFLFQPCIFSLFFYHCLVIFKILAQLFEYL